VATVNRRLVMACAEDVRMKAKKLGEAGESAGHGNGRRGNAGMSKGNKKQKVGVPRKGWGKLGSSRESGGLDGE